MEHIAERLVAERTGAIKGAGGGGAAGAAGAAGVGLRTGDLLDLKSLEKVAVQGGGGAGGRGRGYVARDGFDRH